MRFEWSEREWNPIRNDRRLVDAGMPRGPVFPARAGYSMIEHDLIRRGEGKTFGIEIVRKAARAIVRRGDLYLLIHSAKVGDYKFPGGGLEANEDFHTALEREIREECGMDLASMGELRFRIREMRESRESAETAFTMLSEYYECSVKDGAFGQKLDPYEESLGFRPRWISLVSALDENRRISRAPEEKPAWIEREIWVMETIVGDGDRR